MTDSYVVVGNPIAHSKSPQIHARFAEQTGQDMRYATLLAPLDGFAATVDAFRRGGGLGMNVTVPFKLEAFELCAHRTDRAELAGAVNTLWFDDDAGIGGDNTDGVGLCRDLEVNHGVTLKGARVLLLGAGGAALGAVGPLLDAGPRELTVANRTEAKARDLVERAVRVRGGDTGEILRACPLDGLRDGYFDVAVNATAASLAGELPAVSPDVMAPGSACYDMMYAAEPTPFVRWGERAGARLSLDGLGMLVEQAAESFLRWRGVRPDTRPAIEALRAV